MSTGSSQIRCKGCRVVSTKDDIWLCVQCRGWWCDKCWDRISAHNPNLEEDDPFAVDVGSSVIGAHEKLSRDVFNRLSRVFTPMAGDAHETELEAKWFGIHRGDKDQLYIGETSRLTSIINDSWTAEHPDQYPSIISFVGQTGAGKSTIIRTLLSLQQQLAGREDEDVLLPIPRRPGDPDPTTGDVHLYPDPATQWTAEPLLFADCEGLDAGDKTPVALSNTSGGDRIRAFRGRAKRKIAWASGSKQLKRDAVVEKLFPKILYTISDVVVFVLKAARTLEKVVSEHLIPWTAKSINSAVNQAVRPHVIIVFNGEDISIAGDEWDYETSTKKYLDSLKTSFRNDKYISPIVKDLPRDVAAGLQTYADLLMYCYSSVTVINVPQKTYLMKVDAQLRTLYDVIKTTSSLSLQRKKESRSLLKAERLERDELKREFVDGELYHNCPVKVAMSEKRLLRADVRMEHPNVLLSVGTGKGHPTQENSIFRPAHRGFGRRGIIAKAWEITAGLLGNIFECQSTWSEFLREATEQHRRPEIREYTSRYIRLNFAIPGVAPKLYMFEKMDEMGSLVYAKAPSKAKEIAHRLVASCFYFRLDYSRSGSNYLEVNGTIACRFGDDPAKVKALGRFLDRFLQKDISPSFLFQADFRLDAKGTTQKQPGDGERVIITAANIKDMCDNGTFSRPEVKNFQVMQGPSGLFRVSLCLERDQVYSHGDSHLSISGFPRRLEERASTEEFRANRKDPSTKLPTPRTASSSPQPPPPYEAAVREGSTGPANS